MFDLEDAEYLFGGCLFFIVVLALLLLVLFTLFTHWEVSEDNVSGIVYNTTNNAILSGATDFKIRAAVDTYVNESNESSYCLPPGSPYKDLVNQAAANKSIKVVVTTRKGFWVKLPWTCVDYVTVKRAN